MLNLMFTLEEFSLEKFILHPPNPPPNPPPQATAAGDADEAERIASQASLVRSHFAPSAAQQQQGRYGRKGCVV